MVAPGVGAAGLSGIASGWSPVLDAPADERAASAQQADERAAPAQHTDAFAAPAQHTDAEVPTTTDGFGMPAVLMDAPVLPALRPIEEIEAELSDPPESAVPTPRVARPLPRLATELPPAPHALGARRAAPLTQAPAADAVPSASDAAPASQAAGAASQVWTPSPGPGVGPSAARSPVAPQAKRHAPNPIVPESLRRPPSPWQAVYGAWIGIVSVIVWPLGVVALALGAWSLVLAVREGYGRPRPVIAIVGGVIGISLGVGFLLFGPS
jgi:hypothetical protein